MQTLHPFLNFPNFVPQKHRCSANQKMERKANTYRYKYIANFDTDEVIVPQKHDSWSAMMEDSLKESASNPNTIGWHFRHVYFLDGMTEGDKTIVREEAMTGEDAPISTIPQHLHMLNHIFRSANHSRGESYID